MALPDVATVDGYDVQMQTNHLSHFLLASIVLPALQTAAEVSGSARIVGHSSAARKSPGTPCDAKYYGKNGGDLGGDSATVPKWERYHQSKLANVLFTGALKVSHFHSQHTRASECSRPTHSMRGCLMLNTVPFCIHPACTRAVRVLSIRSTAFHTRTGLLVTTPLHACMRARVCVCMCVCVGNALHGRPLNHNADHVLRRGILHACGLCLVAHAASLPCGLCTHPHMACYGMWTCSSGGAG